MQLGAGSNDMLRNIPTMFYLSFLILWEIQLTSGLTCYSCSYANTGTDAGKECLEEPWNVTTANTVTCTVHGDICITRGVYQKASHDYQSFTRGCGPYLPACSEDVYFITCSTRCSTHLCNSGKLVIPGVGDNGGGGGTVTLKPSAALVHVMSTVLIFTLGLYKDIL